MMTLNSINRLKVIIGFLALLTATSVIAGPVRPLNSHQRIKNHSAALAPLSAGTIGISPSSGGKCLPTTLTAGYDEQDVISTNFLSTTLKSKLVAFFPFVNGNLTDASGNGNNAQAVNSPTASATRFGTQNGAVKFTAAASTAAKVPNLANLTDYTIAYWVKTVSLGGTGSDWFFGAGLVDAEIPNVFPDFGTSLLDGKIAFGQGGGIGFSAGQDKTILSQPINDGTWHFVSATREASSGDVKLYIDGILVASDNADFNGAVLAVNFTLGSLGTDINFADAELDEVMLFSDDLSGAEVTELMNNSQPYTYQWSSVGTNLTLGTQRTELVSQPDQYKVVATSLITGLLHEGTVTIEDWTTFVPTITKSAATIPNGGSVDLTAELFSGTTTYQWSTGETSRTISITAPGTYTVKASNGGCFTQTNSISVTFANAVADWGWVGNGSSDNPANWYFNGLPSTTTPDFNLGTENITVISGFMKMTQDLISAAVNNFTVMSGATVIDTTFGTNYGSYGVRVNGNFTNNGTYSAALTVKPTTSISGTGNFNFTSLAFEGNLNDVFNFNVNAKINKAIYITEQARINFNNKIIRLKSNEFYTAGIYPGNAIVGGGAGNMTLTGTNNFIVERYINPAIIPANADGLWLNLAIPLSGVTMFALGQNGNTLAPLTYNQSSATGSSIYLYDPTNNLIPTNLGYYKPTSPSQTLPLGTGIRLWVRKSAVLAGPLVFQGVLPSSGMSFTPAFCNSNCTYTGANPNGYNLIGNPLPATISWTSVIGNTLGMNGAYYMWRADRSGFASFSGGVGVNGATDEIASGQGFFVEANQQASNFDINYFNTSLNTSANRFRSGAIPNVLKVSLASNSKTEDEVALRLSPNASLAYDQLDAKSMATTNTGIALMASGNQKLAINAIPDHLQVVRVPVVLTNANSNSSISFEGLSSFADHTVSIYHPLLGMLPITDGMVLPLNDLRLHTGLELVVGRVVTGLTAKGINNFSLYPNPTVGKLQVLGLEAGSAFTIHNTQGKTMLQDVLTDGLTVNLEQLPPGIYWFCSGLQKAKIVKE